MTEYIPVEKILNESDLRQETDSGGERSDSVIERRLSDFEKISTVHVESKLDIKRDGKMAKIRFFSFRPDWFVKDGLGITCSSITYFLILFAEFVVIGVILLPGFPGSAWSYIHALLFSGFAFLAASSHLRAMTTNPGTIPRGNFTDENVKSLGLKAGDVVVRCTRCECIKLDRAHHCSTCQRCIKKMDHHCPCTVPKHLGEGQFVKHICFSGSILVINNCVGESNQKYFVLFTFYIMTISAYAMVLAVHYILKCSDKDWKDTLIRVFSVKKFNDTKELIQDHCAYFSPATTIIFIVFLIFEGLLFGLFTLVMLCTQINSVIQDETGIEHLKKESREKSGSWKERMKETFGGNFGPSWFSPFSSNVRRRNEFSYYDV